MRLSLLLMLVVGCGDDGGSDGGDAAADAPADARMDGRPMDAGLDCEPDCLLGLSCCPGAEDVPACTDTVTDTLNCGFCGNDCVATNRGTECAESRCVCGGARLGCGGGSERCCPPRTDGGMHYCADIDLDGDDCGGCNRPCDLLQADRCAAGMCFCGEEMDRACAGTPEDRCCPDLFAGVRCVDTTRDLAHCGGCGRACRASERCLDGLCTAGPGTCPDGCDDGFICCYGACCSRGMCEIGSCPSLRDGGLDGDAPDGGT